MDNGELGIQQGVVTGHTDWGEFIVRWDTSEEFDTEEVGDYNFEQFDGKVLSEKWEFTHINDDGTLKA